MAHQGESKFRVVSQLVKKGICRAYCYQLIKEIENKTYFQPKKKRGRKEIVLNKTQKRRLRRLTDGKIAPS